MKVIGKAYVLFLNQTPFFIGVSIGIAVSLIVIPLVEDPCSWHGYSEQLVKGRDLQGQIGNEQSNDDYEPLLNLLGRPKKSSNRAEKLQLIRPRYYSTELGIKEKLFVGILTNSQTIKTLGAALNKTLSKHVNKLVYFISGPDPENLKATLSSVVSFTDERTVLVPFHMLKYIADNFLKDYDFFFFARDSTYIRGMKLHSFVNSISVSQSIHVGELLNTESLYCALESGILLTHNVLKKSVENIDWCIQHTFSENDSDNFGRCILHGTNLPCVPDIQGSTFSSLHVPKDSSLSSTFQRLSWQKDLKNVLTVYPISEAQQHFQIHQYFCQQELIDTEHMIQDIQEQIVNMSHLLPQGGSDPGWPVGLEPPFKPHNRFDVIQWVYFNDSHSFLPDEFTVVSELKGVQKLDVDDIKRTCIEWVKKKYNKQFVFHKMVNGYRHFDPTRGMEYKLDMQFLDEKEGRRILKRFEVVRPLSQVEIVPVPFVTEHTRIVLVLILKISDREEAVKFLEYYAKACLEKQDNTVLLVVFLYGPDDPGKGDKNDVFGTIKNVINSYTNKYRSIGAKIAWLSIRTAGKTLSHISIMDLVVRKLTPESMVLLCQVGMEIHAEYLNRVRMNTILKTQVFFPIPFVQYHPAVAFRHLTFPDVVEVKKDLGHFDIYNYDHTSFYIFDYLTSRKTIEKEVPVVRFDKDLKNEQLYTLKYGLFEMFLKSKLIHVMRAVEPDLRLRFLMKECDSDLNTAAYSNCLLSRQESLGTKSQLAALILTQGEHHSSARVEINDDL